MTRPGLQDAERAMTDARYHLDAAAASDDEAVKADRYRQAGQRLIFAGGILKGLAPETVTPGRWGADLALPNRARLPGLTAPGPR